MGVFLYFLAGLLPDPEGPWSPTAAHAWPWATASLTEAVIAAVLCSAQSSMRLPKSFVGTMNGLGYARIAVFVLMIATLSVREYNMSNKPKSTPEERQSLLENGNGTSGSYASIEAAPVSDKAKRTQVSGMGWFDYFAGFRILFPYLWYEHITYWKMKRKTNTSLKGPRTLVFTKLLWLCACSSWHASALSTS